MSIETGCVTGTYVDYFLRVYSAEYWISAELALSAAIVLILVYLPGRPPYYGAAATVVAKIYSNSMMTILNSRIQPVSNVFASPLWNELVKAPHFQKQISH